MELSLHANAATTPKTRAYIQRSKRSVAKLAAELGVSETTIRRWRGRSTVADRPHTPKTLRTSLTAIEERLVCELQLFCGDRLICTDLRCGSAPTRKSSVGVSNIFYRMRLPIRRQSRPCSAESEDFHCRVRRDGIVRSALPPISISSIRARAALRPSRLRSNAIGRVKAPSRSRSHPADRRSAPQLVPCPGVATPLSINSSARRGGPAAIKR